MTIIKYLDFSSIGDIGKVYDEMRRLGLSLESRKLCLNRFGELHKKYILMIHVKDRYELKKEHGEKWVDEWIEKYQIRPHGLYYNEIVKMGAAMMKEDFKPFRAHDRRNEQISNDMTIYQLFGIYR